MHQPIGLALTKLRRSILAAAIDHDDFRRRLRAQVAQKRRDERGLVEHRNYNRERIRTVTAHL